MLPIQIKCRSCVGLSTIINRLSCIAIREDCMQKNNSNLKLLWLWTIFPRMLQWQVLPMPKDRAMLVPQQQFVAMGQCVWYCRVRGGGLSPEMMRNAIKGQKLVRL